MARPALVHTDCRVTPGVGAQLLDLVAGKSATGASAWLDVRPHDWLAAIKHGMLDLSGPYRKTFQDSLPDATLVADPFHLVKLANTKLDECCRRVQNDVMGHRGRKDHPLYRARRLLTKAHERLDQQGQRKLLGLLAAGDPHGEVRMAWHAKEVVRSIYEIPDAKVAGQFVAQLGVDLQDPSCPPEVHSLGRTLLRWHDEIVNWHKASVTNGPTEAVNNLIKRSRGSGSVPPVHPHRLDGHGDAWRLLEQHQEQIKVWLEVEDLTVAKVRNLLCRQGVVVPTRTLERFAAGLCGPGGAGGPPSGCRRGAG